MPQGKGSKTPITANVRDGGTTPPPPITAGGKKITAKGGTPPPTMTRGLEFFRRKRHFLPKKTLFLGQFSTDFFLAQKGVTPPPPHH